MVVVETAQLVVLQPSSRLFVEILANVGSAAAILTLNIKFHLFEESLLANALGHLSRRVQGVCQGCERLCRCERPYCAVPLAFALAVSAELRVAALGGCKTERSGESLLVVNLLPCHVATVRNSHVYIPRQISYSLANACK